MDSLSRWLSLLASSLGGKLHFLDTDSPNCKKMMGKKKLDVTLVPVDVCRSCDAVKGCRESFSVLVRFVDRLCLFNFQESISNEQKCILLDLLSLTVRMVDIYNRNRGQQKHFEFYQKVLFFLASRFFSGFYLKYGGDDLSLISGDYPLSFYEDLEQKRRKLETDEGSLESEKQTFWFKSFPEKGNDGGILYWQPKEISSLQFSQNRSVIMTVPLIGKNPAFLEALNLIKKTASSENTILLYGESGTGKELFARAIHLLSPRRDQPFIAINCAAIPENLLESELFGYEEGSFTGAKKGGKPGKFELADGGTLFLDEIGDMPLALQAKLLRVLQDKKLERVGGTKPIPVNIRFIAATHRNLEELVQRNLFRQDLYFRLNVIPIKLPALRDRKEDIEPLLNYFIKKHTILQNKPFKIFAPDVIDFFKSYSWPGNIRELENVVAYAVSVCSEDIIELKDLQPYLKKDYVSNAGGERSGHDFHRKPVPGREELIILLKQYGQTTAAKKEIARHLGISLATLYRWLQRHHIK